MKIFLLLLAILFIIVFALCCVGIVFIWRLTKMGQGLDRHYEAFRKGEFKG